MRRSWSILGAGTVAVLLAACGTDEGSVPAPAVASSAAPTSYSGLRGECPALESAESERFTGSRPGRLLPLPGQQKDHEWINCNWRSPAAASWVNLVIQIYRDGYPPTQTGRGNAEANVARSVASAATRAESEPAGTIRAEGRRPPTGPASLLADGANGSLSQSTAAGNAVVTVMLFKAADPGTDPGAIAADLTATVDAITVEVVEQLVAR